MDLNVIKEIEIDFYGKKYVSINAKQYDRGSRYLLVTCVNQDEVVSIDKDLFCYARYRKADDLGVYESCQITNDGKILVELTEQMLVAIGVCYLDIVIIENKAISINENIGELLISDNDSILATMTVYVNVTEAAFYDPKIESSSEYNALNDLMIRATEDYQYVMRACKISEVDANYSSLLAKSYAVGNSNLAERPNENVDNAKYYCENAGKSAIEAKDAAKTSRENLENLNCTFNVMGTIPFAKLADIENSDDKPRPGDIYNIEDNFVIDDRFLGYDPNSTETEYIAGEANSYAAGTNVYCTAIGIPGTEILDESGNATKKYSRYYWDCFAGTVSLTQGNIASIYEFCEALNIPVVLMDDATITS